MQAQGNHVSGHVYRQERRKGTVWYWRIRRPDGTEERKAIGPEWSGRGRTPSGYFTRRTAEAALAARVTDLRRGAGETPKIGVTFADASAAWLHHVEHERMVKPSTLTGYSNAAAFFDREWGSRAVGSITREEIEQWRSMIATGRKPRTVNKLTTTLHAVFEVARKRWGIPNPVAEVERLRQSYSGRIETYSPEEVWALVRAAADEQDGAMYLTAAFTGLRMGELRALRWGRVDFANSAVRVVESFSEGTLTTPKSGRVRSVPMAPEVAAALARLGQRQNFTGPNDLVFAGEAGGPLDSSALRRRYRGAQKRAWLRPLRFHDLRHCFGSTMVNRASIVQVREWMGHADLATTQRYLHFKSRADDAQLVADAFRVEAVSPAVSRNSQIQPDPA